MTMAMPHSYSYTAFAPLNRTPKILSPLLLQKTYMPYSRMSLIAISNGRGTIKGPALRAPQSATPPNRTPGANAIAGRSGVYCSDHGMKDDSRTQDEAGLPRSCVSWEAVRKSSSLRSFAAQGVISKNKSQQYMVKTLRRGIAFWVTFYASRKETRDMTLSEELRGRQEFLTTVEVMSLLQVTRGTLCQWVRSGRITAIRAGNAYLFDPRILADWLTARTTSRDRGAA